MSVIYFHKENHGKLYTKDNPHVLECYVKKTVINVPDEFPFRNGYKW